MCTQKNIYISILLLVTYHVSLRSSEQSSQYVSPIYSPISGSFTDSMLGPILDSEGSHDDTRRSSDVSSTEEFWEPPYYQDVGSITEWIQAVEAVEQEYPPQIDIPSSSSRRKRRVQYANPLAVVAPAPEPLNESNWQQEFSTFSAQEPKAKTKCSCCSCQ